MIIVREWPKFEIGAVRQENKAPAKDTKISIVGPIRYNMTSDIIALGYITWYNLTKYNITLDNMI